jgi:hypothetical protein
MKKIKMGTKGLGLVVIILFCVSVAYGQPIHPAQKISIANLTMTSADTEYSYTLPNNTVYFAVKARTNNAWKIAFSSGTSGTVYETVPAGAIWYPDHPLLLSSNRIFYAQSSTAGLILEIEIYQ